MKASVLIHAIENQGVRFFTGVPDSQLRPLCDALMERKGISKEHIIAANEGNCIALASGEYLSAGRPACVYLQNSGLGNCMNPLCSLTHQKVYGIPMIFVVGWRGEPGVHDEPQHVFQGEVTLNTLRLMEIPYTIIGPDTDEQAFLSEFQVVCAGLAQGKSAAVVVRKGGLQSDERVEYKNEHTLGREQAIEIILQALPADCAVVSSTGKISREVFEVRRRLGQGHQMDFLTVGSMGHCSSIALRIALNKPKLPVVCLDGDGALLMHLGALPVIASQRPHNLLHIVLDNGAHETVGGMPTATQNVNWQACACACGYTGAFLAEREESLREFLQSTLQTMQGPVFLHVPVALGARDDLGRPTRSTMENRNDFMKFLEEKQ